VGDEVSNGREQRGESPTRALETDLPYERLEPVTGRRTFERSYSSRTASVVREPGRPGTSVLVAVIVLALVSLASAGACAGSGESNHQGSASEERDLPALPLIREGATAAEVFAPEEVSYELADSLPALGGAGKVWRLTTPPLDDTRLVEVAAVLGIGGTVIERDDQRFVESTDGSIGVYDSLGRWEANYQNGQGSIRPPQTGGPPPNIPDDSAAEQIAGDFLEGLGVDIEGWEAHVGAGGTTIEQTPQVFSRGAQFEPVFDGVPMSQLGWNLQIGEGGTVAFALGTFAEWEDVGEYPLRTVAEAYDNLVAGTALMPDRSGVGGISVENVVVTGADLSLGIFAAEENGERVGYLVPTYAFRIEVPGEDDVLTFEVVAVDSAHIAPA
jgi:hypothetical protein